MNGGHGGVNMAKWRCKICEHIYDEDLGDPDHGISPGTKFEELPEDYKCPICGVGKDMFEKVE